VKADSTIETPRLKLRPYTEEDIAELLPLIGAREVAVTTLRIPHPYREKDAREFIAATRQGPEIRRALILRETGRLIGGAGLNVEESHCRAELGYWIGLPYWGQGYATEAASALVCYGFEELRLHRIFASHFRGNEASARVLKRLGMHFEGSQREHICKWEQFIDLELYGMLRQDWNAVKSSDSCVSG
jgi:[ribosomal protein S5]-alanine N-acetyltransferase